MNKKLILFIIVLIIGGVYVFTIGSANPLYPEGKPSIDVASIKVGEYQYDPSNKLYYTRTAEGHTMATSSEEDIIIEIEVRENNG